MKGRVLGLDRVATALGLAAGAAMALWQGFQRVQTRSAQVGVLATVAAMVCIAVWSGRGRQRKSFGSSSRMGRDPTHPGPDRTWAYSVGGMVWVLLVCSVFGWDLYSFLRQSHDLPTLSYLIGRITRFRAGRVGLFAAWILAGGYLAVGWRNGDRS